MELVFHFNFHVHFFISATFRYSLFHWQVIIFSFLNLEEICFWKDDQRYYGVFTWNLSIQIWQNRGNNKVNDEFPIPCPKFHWNQLLQINFLFPDLVWNLLDYMIPFWLKDGRKIPCNYQIISYYSHALQKNFQIYVLLLILFPNCIVLIGSQ